MFGRGGDSKSVGVVKTTSENRFSLPYLRKLHQQLVENKVVSPENQEVVIEILRVIAEMVVYGDNKSEILFDFFCEKNMLSLFLELMGTEGGCPNAVHIQILQTLSILISCVKNNTSLYYLLSNNYVNEIINHPHNFENDESLRDQFASFMKSLSLRLNKQTVQFFFIEETGCFPILTRAIDLLYLNDNMVRIASQTTILNIYRVVDFRARAYALQSNVLQTLFDAVSAIMLAQYKSVLQVCEQYAVLSSSLKNGPKEEDTRGRLVALEHQLEDLQTQTEDWLYYLQDMCDLKIMIFRRALVKHLMNSFVLPVLLPNLISSDQSQSQAAEGAPVAEAADSLSTQAEETPTSDHVDEVVHEWEHISLMASIAQLSVVLRVVNDPMLRRALLTALMHPLSRRCRQCLITAMADCETRGDSSSTALENASVSLEINPFCRGFMSIFTDSAGALLGSNLLRIAAEVLLSSSLQIASSWSAYDESNENAEADNSNAQALAASNTAAGSVKALSCLTLWPENYDGVANDNSTEVLLFEGPVTVESTPLPRSRKSWGATHQGRSANGSSPDEDESANDSAEPDDLDLPRPRHHREVDAMHIQVLQAMQQWRRNSMTGGGDCMLQVLGKVTVSPGLPLCAVQEAVHAIYGTACLANLATRSDPYYQGHVRYCLEITRNCGRQLSSRLLARMATPMGDLLLNLLQEELHRIRGRRWSQVSSQMSKDVLIHAPTLSTRHPSQSTDLESSVPVTQNESARREIQAFILVRSMYKQLLMMLEATEPREPSMDDVTVGAVDTALLGLTDRGLIPTHLQNGQTFDMRGKKFLDATVYSRPSGVPPKPSASGAGQAGVAGSLSPEESSNLLAASIFGFGFLGAPAEQGSGSTTAISPQQGLGARASNVQAAPPQPKRKVGEILFVQSPSLFLLVETKDEEFFVWLAAPIHQTDVSLSQSKKKLVVFVRSWERIEHMELVGSELDAVNPGNGINVQGPNRRSELLRPRQQGSLYRITLHFENDNSCQLAAQHIESKRLKMRANRLQYFRSLLEAWAREGEPQALTEPKETVKIA